MKSYLLIILFFSSVQLLAYPSGDSESARRFLNKGILFHQQHELDSASFYVRSAIKTAQRENDMKTYCDAALRISALYINSRSYDSARFWNQKAMEVSHQHQFKKREASAYAGLGMIALRQEQLLDAVSSLKKAYNMMLDAGDAQGAHFTAYNLALTYSRLSDVPKALQYLRTSLVWAREQNNTSFQRSIYHLIARLFRQSNEPDSVNHYEQLSLRVPEKGGNSNSILPYFLAMANRLKMNKKIDSALYYYDSAMEIAIENRDTVTQLNIMVSKAMTALDANQPSKALSILRKVHHNQNKLQGKIDMAVYYETMANAWKQKKQSDSALFYTEKLLAEKENLHIRQNQKYLMELRVKYQAQQKESELIRLKNEVLKSELEQSVRKVQMNTLLGSSFSLLLILIFLTWFYLYRRKKDRMIQQQEVAFLQKEKEAGVAQSLLAGEENERKRIARELHDGLGVLLSSASIFFSNLEEDTDPEREKNLQKARSLVDKANTEVRRISHNLMPMVLSRFGLKAALEDMVDKVSGDLNVYLNVSMNNALSDTIQVTLYRLVQELLNNTLKYAEASEVEISMVVKSDKVHFGYSDNGKGFNTKDKVKSDGIGLVSIRNRVEFLKGNMEYVSEPGKGVTVNISFPVHHN
ncbi:MAG: hypothetical protein JXR65_02555 [Bacteroidales bacterium]|nr:hypothetical protein [Bacteroidales bacterium]